MGEKKKQNHKLHKTLLWMDSEILLLFLLNLIIWGALWIGVLASKLHADLGNNSETKCSSCWWGGFGQERVYQGRLWQLFFWCDYFFTLIEAIGLNNIQLRIMSIVFFFLCYFNKLCSTIIKMLISETKWTILFGNLHLIKCTTFS